MCDTVVVVRPGQVLFAKNSDRDANEAQVLDWQPAAEHAPGATVRCTWLTIPQARRTHAVLLSRPFWMWGAEMGTNEHGVTLGNEAVYTHQPYRRAGLTGMDLLRLALERAASAAEAVEVIVGLISAHGQGGGCGLEDPRASYHSSFLVADPRGAFVLETAGQHTAVEAVVGTRTLSNALSLPAFARRHANRVMDWGASSAARRARSHALAERATDAADLVTLLRDHGGGQTPHYGWMTGGLGCLCAHGGGLVASAQTTGSWASVLAPGHCQHWATGTAAPCTGLFKPVAVDAPVAGLGAPTERVDATSLWWRHERLHRRVAAAPSRPVAQYLAERDAVERAWLRAPPPSHRAFEEADALLSRWTVATGEGDAADDERPWWARRYWRRRSAWAGLRSN